MRRQERERLNRELDIFVDDLTAEEYVPRRRSMKRYRRQLASFDRAVDRGR